MTKKPRMIDIIDIKTLVKLGILESFVKNNVIYLRNVENGETVKIGEIKGDDINDQEMVP